MSVRRMCACSVVCLYTVLCVPLWSSSPHQAPVQITTSPACPNYCLTNTVLHVSLCTQIVCKGPHAVYVSVCRVFTATSQANLSGPRWLALRVFSAPFSCKEQGRWVCMEIQVPSAPRRFEFWFAWGPTVSLNVAEAQRRNTIWGADVVWQIQRVEDEDQNYLPAKLCWGQNVSIIAQKIFVALIPTDIQRAVTGAGQFFPLKHLFHAVDSSTHVNTT